MVSNGKHGCRLAAAVLAVSLAGLSLEAEAATPTASSCRVPDAFLDVSGELDRTESLVLRKRPVRVMMLGTGGISHEILEKALEAREHSLLATVPAMLEKRFKRLRQAALPAPDAPETDAAPMAWLPVFHQDIRDLLLAELDFRFQPVDGLLEALRSS